MVSSRSSRRHEKGTVRVGVYALLIQVPKNEKISIGHLGSLEFAPGVYVYVGSALNSLKGRISRHLRRTKRKHWHIDYLLGRTNVAPIGVATMPTLKRMECVMAQKIARTRASGVRRFGCSDCNCRSHLYYLGTIQNSLDIMKRAGWPSITLNPCRLRPRVTSIHTTHSTFTNTFVQQSSIG